MTRVFLRYQLDRTAIPQYITAAWGIAGALPIRTALNTIMEHLTKQDSRITLDKNGDFSDPKHFPEEFIMEELLKVTKHILPP